MSELVSSKRMGANALKVWETLTLSVAGISIQELCRQLALSFSDVLDAIRWLSKDHNIGLQMTDDECLIVAH